jgi:hypothetical protein
MSAVSVHLTNVLPFMHPISALVTAAHNIEQQITKFQAEIAEIPTSL